MIEEWKDIKDYEGLYQVSNFGRVRSLPKEWITGWNNVKRKHSGFILKPSNHGGYLAVTLSKNKINKYKSVHRLVLQAFIGESNLDCNHKDGDKSNNYLNNLEYCTESENALHAYKIGLNKNIGENHRSSKLNNDIIKNIRENKFGLTTREFASCYGITKQTVHDILNKRTWAHVS